MKGLILFIFALFTYGAFIGCSNNSGSEGNNGFLAVTTPNLVVGGTTFEAIAASSSGEITWSLPDGGGKFSNGQTTIIGGTPQVILADRKAGHFRVTVSAGGRNAEASFEIKVGDFLEIAKKTDGTFDTNPAPGSSVQPGRDINFHLVGLNTHSNAWIIVALYSDSKCSKDLSRTGDVAPVEPGAVDIHIGAEAPSNPVRCALLIIRDYEGNVYYSTPQKISFN